MTNPKGGMTTEQQNQAVAMARNGKTVAQIERDLGVDYWAIWDHIRSVGAYSWQGAKWIITRRLNSLVRENGKTQRKELAEETKEMVDYLYYQGRRLGRTLDRVKKTVE